MLIGIPSSEMEMDGIQKEIKKQFQTDINFDTMCQGLKDKWVVISMVVATMACESSLQISYPPTEWPNTDTEMLLNVLGQTRNDTIQNFGVRSQNGTKDANLSCVFENVNLKDLIEIKSDDSITNIESSTIYIDKICELLARSQAQLVFSDTSLGDFVVFKYSDNAELAYLKSSSDLDPRWTDYFSDEFKISPSWYFRREKGLMFNLPD